MILQAILFIQLSLLLEAFYALLCLSELRLELSNRFFHCFVLILVCVIFILILFDLLFECMYFGFLVVLFTFELNHLLIHTLFLAG